MKKEWQICEIEDDTKSFIEHSIAALPIIWTFRKKDGTVWCYWPKTNVLKNIKSCVKPVRGRNWKIYKCRILLNEVHFQSYAEAKEAEIKMESESESECGENALNSTMDFEVICDDGEKNGGEYIVESEDSDYSSHFKPNTASTFLDVNDGSSGIDDLPTNNSETILSAIRDLDTSVSLFFQDTQKQLRDMKEFVEMVSKKRNFEPDSSSEPKRPKLVNYSSTNQILNTTYYIGKATAPLESNATFHIGNAPVPTDSDATSFIVKVPVQPESINVNEIIAADVGNGDAPLHIVEINAANTDEPANPQATLQEETETYGDNTDPVVRLPVGSMDHWAETDLLVEDIEWDTAVTEHLSPMKNETESAYFNRTALMLFTKWFLVEKISWRKEKERAWIKHSNILDCWKKSHMKTFPEDAKNERFMANIRRIKSTLRAADKSSLKAAMKSATKAKVLRGSKVAAKIHKKQSKLAK